MQKSIIILLLILTAVFSPSNNARADGDDAKETTPSQLETLNHHVEDWEWMFLEDGQFQKSSYPVTMEYYTYPSHPNYVVRLYPQYGNAVIFDRNGSLVRVAYLDTGSYGLNFDLANNHSRIEEKKQSLEDEKNALENVYKSQANNLVTSAIKRVNLPKGYCLLNCIRLGNNNAIEVKLYQDDYSYYRGIDRGLSAIAPDEKSFYLLAKGPKSYREINSMLENGKKVEIKYDLSAKDLEKVGDFLGGINLDTSMVVLKLIQRDVDAKGKKKNIAIVPKLQPMPIQNQPEIAINPSDVVSINYYSGKENEIIKQCRIKLIYKLMADDYLNNKYNVQQESADVHRIIEEKLGLRKKTEELSPQSEAMIKRICQRMGINYQTGMTHEQVNVALRKKHPNWTDAQIAEALAAVALDEMNSAMEGGLLLGAATGGAQGSNQSAKSIADRYVKQLWNDHEGEAKNIISIDRIDDVSFNVVFQNNRVMRVEYFSNESFSYKCNVYYLDK